MIGTKNRTQVSWPKDVHDAKPGAQPDRPIRASAFGPRWRGRPVNLNVRRHKGMILPPPSP